MMDEVLSGRILQYFIPSFFSILFRVYGLGAKSRKHAIWGVAHYIAFSLVISGILIYTLDYDTYVLVAYPLAMIANLAVFIISPDGFLKTCFLHFTQINAVFWVTITASSLRHLYDMSYAQGNLIRLGLSVLAFGLGMRYAARPLRFIVNTIRGGWLGLLAIPLLIHLGTMGMSVYLGTQPTYPAVVMMIFTTLLGLSFLFYMIGLSRALRESDQFAKARHHHGILQAEIHAFEEAVETTRQHRHDLHHHNAVLLDYLACHQEEEAVAYLQGMNRQLDSGTLERFCAHSTANAVLRIYDGKAKAVGIPLTVKANIPQNLPVEEVELATLLSNLLENGVEAACKLPLDQRFITVTADRVDSGWTLELRNPTAEVAEFQGNLPRSTKPGGGCGTRNISEVVENCGGILRFSQEGDVFVSRIFIPMQGVGSK